MTDTAVRLFDEQPQEIEILTNGSVASYVIVRSNIVQVILPENTETGEKSRIAWEASEQEAGGLSIGNYDALVSAVIRVKYTLDAELAILRQRDSKPEEFSEYERFAEAAKVAAKSALGM